MSAFDLTFEELPICRTDDGMFTAPIDGGYHVSFTGPDDFEISDIYLCVDNGHVGLACRSAHHYLKYEADPALWSLVHDAIVERYRDRIEERICYEMAEEDA